MGMGYRMQTSVTWKIKAQIKAEVKAEIKAEIKAFIQASVTPAQTFRRKKLKTQRWSKKVFFSLELEAGTYINLYSFESSMKLPFVKSQITQHEPNENPFTNTDFEGMTL